MSSAKASRMIPASSGAAAAAASSSRASSSIAPSSSSSLCRRLFFQPRRRPLAGGPALAAPNKSAGEAVAELLAAAVAGDETTLLDFVAEEAAVSIAERTAQRRRREQKREEREEEEKDAAGGGEERSSSGEKLTPLTLEDVVRAARPEELSLDSFAVRSLDDPDTALRVDIVGTHAYVSSRMPFPPVSARSGNLSAAQQLKKKIWQTEVGLIGRNVPGIRDGLYWAKLLHTHVAPRPNPNP